MKGPLVVVVPTLVRKTIPKGCGALRTAFLQAEPCFILVPVRWWTANDLFSATWDKPALALPCAKFLSGAQLVFRWYLYQAGRLGVRARKAASTPVCEVSGCGKQGAGSEMRSAECMVEHDFVLRSNDGMMKRG